VQKIIIAVDGFSGCGKSTTAKSVASALGYSYIDSGAMYRAVTLYFDQNYINLTDTKKILKALDNIHITFEFNSKIGGSETFLNGLNVEEEIRTMYISERVSAVSAIPEVRHAMVHLQQKLGKKGGIVMDGRDIGTTVFPKAELKIFVVADMMIRAKRRQDELADKGDLVTLDDVIKNLSERDRIDSTRAESPLRRADDAKDLDTSYLTIDEQVDIVMHLATSKMVEKTKKKLAVQN
jgi:cytidylate kinase